MPVPKIIKAGNIEEFFLLDSPWKGSFEKLREIFRGTELNEDFKWGHPCYTLDDKNVAILQDFKEYCSVMFLKGSLMRDPKGLLVKLTDDTLHQRQLRFTTVSQIEKMESDIKDYIAEAVRVERSGEKLVYKDPDDYDMPDELTDAFRNDPGFKDAFHKLTPGRQKGYLLFFGSAKQAKTRAERIAKYRDRIFDGMGINDR